MQKARVKSSRERVRKKVFEKENDRGTVETYTTLHQYRRYEAEPEKKTTTGETECSKGRGKKLTCTLGEE